MGKIEVVVDKDGDKGVIDNSAEKRRNNGYRYTYSG